MYSRKAYNITVLLLLLICFAGLYFWVQNTLKERRTLLRLKSAKTDEALEYTLKTLPEKPSADYMAQLYSERALVYFNQKNYELFRSTMQHMVDLPLPPKLHYRGKIDQAYSYFMEQRHSEGRECLQSILKEAELPAELRLEITDVLDRAYKKEIRK